MRQQRVGAWLELGPQVDVEVRAVADPHIEPIMIIQMKKKRAISSVQM